MWVSKMPGPHVRPRGRLPAILRGSPQRLLGCYDGCDNTLGAMPALKPKTQAAISGASAGMQTGNPYAALAGAVAGYALGGGAKDLNPLGAAGLAGNMDRAWQDQNLARLLSNPAGALASKLGVKSESTLGKVLDPIGGLFGKKKKKPDNSAAFRGIFDEYMSIAGMVPGRAIGLENMRAIWKGAAYNGHFPKWKSGDEGIIDCAIDGCRGADPNTMNVLIKRAVGAPTVRTPAAPVASSYASKVVGAGRVGVAMQGLLGDLLSGMDAREFIDTLFVPENNRMGTAWASTTDAIGRQILYDVADAYLALNDPSTPVYITNPQTPGPVTTVAAPASSLPTQPTITPTASAPVVPQQSAPLTTATGAPDIENLVQRLLAMGMGAPQAYQSALSSLDAAGYPPTEDIQAATAEAVQAGVGGGVPGWMLALVAGGALMFALARPARGERRA